MAATHSHVRPRFRDETHGAHRTIVPCPVGDQSAVGSQRDVVVDQRNGEIAQGAEERAVIGAVAYCCGLPHFDAKCV